MPRMRRRGAASSWCCSFQRGEKQSGRRARCAACRLENQKLYFRRMLITTSCKKVPPAQMRDDITRTHLARVVGDHSEGVIEVDGCHGATMRRFRRLSALSPPHSASKHDCCNDISLTNLQYWYKIFAAHSQYSPSRLRRQPPLGGGR